MTAISNNDALRKVDVLIVLSSLRAEGTPRLVLDLCRHWLARGLKPLVLDLQRGPAELEADFRALGLPVLRHAVGHSGYRRYLSLAWTIFRLCRRYRPAALLCMPFGLHAPVAFGARMAGVKRCCAHVGNPPGANGMPPRALRKARRMVQLGRSFTHRLICCSAYVQCKTTEHMGVSNSETCVIVNGIDLNAFRGAGSREAQRPSEADHTWILGMVATLEGHKDQATLIRASVLLRDRGHTLDVRLIGDGARRDELTALIDEQAAPVRLLGSRADVPDQIASLDLFVFATTEQEGLGIALIEAMAAGVPVVASDVSACREVLDDGALGLLAAPRDSGALADAIATAMQDWHATQARAARARDKAINTYSAEAMAQQYLEVLGVSGRMEYPAAG